MFNWFSKKKTLNKKSRAVHAYAIKKGITFDEAYNLDESYLISELLLLNLIVLDGSYYIDNPSYDWNDGAENLNANEDVKLIDQDVSNNDDLIINSNPYSNDSNNDSSLDSGFDNSSGGGSFD